VKDFRMLAAILASECHELAKGLSLASGYRVELVFSVASFEQEKQIDAGKSLVDCQREWLELAGRYCLTIASDSPNLTATLHRDSIGELITDFEAWCLGKAIEMPKYESAFDSAFRDVTLEHLASVKRRNAHGQN